MNKCILALLVLLMTTGKSFGQSELPFFEQIAFDFYCSDILKTEPVTKRIRICSDLISSSISYNLPTCLKQSIPIEKDSVINVDYTKYYQSFDSDKFELNFDGIDKKQFKIRKNHGGNMPRLVIGYPKVYKDRYFVLITLQYEAKETEYLLEFDASGHVTDWCKTEIFIVITA